MYAIHKGKMQETLERRPILKFRFSYDHAGCGHKLRKGHQFLQLCVSAIIKLSICKICLDSTMTGHDSITITCGELLT